MSKNDIKDYYYILGLDRYASKDEIKTAYRKLSLKFHPDQNSGDKFFEERFKDLHEAYETLVDDAKRKIYDDKLRASTVNPGEKNYYDTHTPKNRGQQRSPSKKEILLGILGIIIVLSPFLKGAINRLTKKESPETYKLVRYDTTHHTVIDSPDSLITIHRDTTTLPPPIITKTDDPGSLNTAPPAAPDDNTPILNFKDDEGLTAQDAVDYFLDALNNGDCNEAWDMMYNITWVNKGKDWFCSNQAFGTVKKILIENIHTISQYASTAYIYADYYAEDSYNGNKCFKQTITVQKIQYTDNRSRWKVTGMKDIEKPMECYGN